MRASRRTIFSFYAVSSERISRMNGILTRSLRVVENAAEKRAKQTKGMEEKGNIEGNETTNKAVKRATHTVTDKS